MRVRRRGAGLRREMVNDGCPAPIERAAPSSQGIELLAGPVVDRTTSSG